MNAPDTIYIDGKETRCVGGYLCQRASDTDLAYIPADAAYELAKTVEAQKAEIGLLKAENESLAESNLCIRRYEAEIARLRKFLDTYGRHTLACVMLDPFDPRSDCTCGFTAALASPPAAEEPATALFGHPPAGSYLTDCDMDEDESR